MTAKLITMLIQVIIAPYAVGEWDGKRWINCSEIKFKVNGKTYTIPAFSLVTDFGSIPRSCRGLIARMGKGLLPFLIHDWLYCHPDFSRKEADKVLYILLLEEGFWRVTAYPIYLAVRSFGWIFYKKRSEMKPLPDQEEAARIIDRTLTKFKVIRAASLCLIVVSLTGCSTIGNAIQKKWDKGFGLGWKSPWTGIDYSLDKNDDGFMINADKEF